MPEKPKSLPTSGVMTSPNFPADYPNDLHERKTIKVAKGSVINIQFTDFELEFDWYDKSDYVELTDSDGTFLGRLGANHISGEPDKDRPDISEHIPKRVNISDMVLTSVTETVHVLFHTDRSDARMGWRLEWSE